MEPVLALYAVALCLQRVPVLLGALHLMPGESASKDTGAAFIA